MNRQEAMQGNWNELKGRVKETWGDVSDDDFTRAEGSADKLIGIIQQKTGEAREQVQQQLNKLLETGSSTVASAAEQVRAKAEQTAERFQQGYEQASTQLREGYTQAREVVQRRPGESVAMAFGAGLLAGVVIGLTMRSR